MDSHTPVPTDASRAGGDTRSQVMSVLLKRGPVTASDIAEELQLSAAGVRRHVDKLVSEGLAEACAPRNVAGEEQGRGRPAKHFRLTAAGRERFGSNYDGLALDAVELIQRIGGEDAVRDFARSRVEKILGRVEPGADAEETAQRVAAALEDLAATAEAAQTAATRKSSQRAIEALAPASGACAGGGEAGWTSGMWLAPGERASEPADDRPRRPLIAQLTEGRLWPILGISD